MTCPTKGLQFDEHGVLIGLPDGEVVVPPTFDEQGVMVCPPTTSSVPSTPTATEADSGIERSTVPQFSTHLIVPAPSDPLRRVPFRQPPFIPEPRTMTIYRAVNPGVTEIQPGDRVALTKAYAARQGPMQGRGVIISRVVPVEHVTWAGTDMLGDWVYNPERGL